MTDRLAQLLHDEADGLPVPPAPAPAVIARGRGLRTRRRIATGAGALAALALIGTGIALTTSGDDGRGVDPVAPSRSGPDLGAVFSIGTEVYLEGGDVRATIDDGAVKSLFYTSAGVVVRHGDNPYSDGGGKQRFSLVTPDGTVEPVSVETEETYHSTDPTQPILVWAETVRGVVQVVVWDLVGDREVSRTPVPGARSDFLPVSVSGDQVWLRAGEAGFVVDWRTGEVRPEDGEFDLGGVAGGRAAVTAEDRSTVVDVATGEVLLDVEPEGGYSWLQLSPDGRFAKVFVEDDVDPADAVTTVYDVATGAQVEVPGAGYDWGWTSAGDLVSVDDSGEVTTCDAVSGDCATTTPELDVLPNSLEGEPVERCRRWGTARCAPPSRSRTSTTTSCSAGSAGSRERASVEAGDHEDVDEAVRVAGHEVARRRLVDDGRSVARDVR